MAARSCARFAAAVRSLSALRRRVSAPLPTRPDVSAARWRRGSRTTCRWRCRGTPPTGARVRWRAPIPGLSRSSAIVWGNRVYVLSAVAGGSDARHGKPRVSCSRKTRCRTDERAPRARSRHRPRALGPRRPPRNTTNSRAMFRATYANATPARSAPASRSSSPTRACSCSTWKARSCGGEKWRRRIRSSASIRPAHRDQRRQRRGRCRRLAAGRLRRGVRSGHGRRALARGARRGVVVVDGRRLRVGIRRAGSCSNSSRWVRAPGTRRDGHEV